MTLYFELCHFLSAKKKMALSLAYVSPGSRSMQDKSYQQPPILTSVAVKGVKDVSRRAKSIVLGAFLLSDSKPDY